MVAINHELAGALIAVGVKQPWLAAPLAFISHFAMDMLPHWWIQVENGDVRARNAKPLFRIVTRTDFTLSIIGIAALPWFLHNATNWWVVLVCVVAAALPDFYWVYLFFKDQKSGLFSKKSGLVKFHKQIQRLERPWALPIDLTWFVFSLALVVAVR